MKGTNKTNQFFRAVMILSRGRYYTSKELAEELGMELRTIYRYIDDLKGSEFFTFEQRGKRFRISPESLFWTSIVNNLYLSDKEAQALAGFLDEIDVNDDVLTGLRNKVRNIVGNHLEPVDTDSDVVLAENISNIQKSMDNHRLCILRGYTSLHSGTKTDRLVEPFLFLGSKNDVRCYELASQMNKTFKLSRCESVEVLDVEWQFEKKHKKMFTDIFHFSDEKKTRVRLILGTLSKTILVEEHAEARKHLIPTSDGRWLLDAEYCSMKGVGRFYLGLFEDIEIVESPEFKEYLTTRVKTLTNRVKL